jgi:very-short-patch-repair endonuclease
MEDYVPHHPSKLPEDLRAYARELRGRMTDAEALLWMLLRNRRIAGAKFRRQHPVGRYILDFYCDEKKLGIELDGGQHGEAVKYDEKRGEWLRQQGIRILRFWNNQMLAETEAVMEAIYQAIVESENKAVKVPPP